MRMQDCLGRMLGLSALVAWSVGTAGSALSAPARDPNTGVVNDGREIAPDELRRTYSPSSAGAAEIAGALDALAEIKGRRESPTELDTLEALQAVSGPQGIEVIIGPDNRVRVNPTTSLPARATVLVTFSAGRCTGWLINSNTVVTAGHCVHPGGGGSFYPPGSYRVYPGRNGSCSPYGSCTARTALHVIGWTVNGDDDTTTARSS